MLLRAVKVELIKLRRAPIWVVFVALPLLTAVIGTFNYIGNIDILTQQWYSLWTQHTLFLCYFFLPALIGATCSYQWRLEHNGKNWNLELSMPMPLWLIFVSKLIVGAIMLFAAMLVIGVLFISSGLLVGLTDPLPPMLPVWLITGWVAGISIVSLQLLISLIVRNFGIPVGIALFGGILGIGVSAQGLGLFWPYSLIQLGMASNGTQQLASSDTMLFAIMCAIFICIPVFIAIWWLIRHDIKTA